MRTPSATTGVLTAVAVAIAVAAGCSSSDGAGEPMRETTVAATVETTDAVAEGPDGDTWTPRDVVDGDTILVERSGREARVRIIGINTPESGECLAEDAAERLEALVADRTLRLVRDSSDTDRFGRLLRYVTGCGTDRRIDGGAVVHWCTRGSAVWNNSGDTVFLRDRSGNLVVSLTYDDS